MNMRPNFATKSKSFTTARKSMLKLVKLQSLVAKCCKIRKVYACEVCKFCTLFVFRLPQNGRNSPDVRPFCGKRTTKVYKICKRIFSLFYNISPPNLAVLLILTCTF